MSCIYALYHIIMTSVFNCFECHVCQYFGDITTLKSITAEKYGPGLGGRMHSIDRAAFVKNCYKHL